MTIKFIKREQVKNETRSTRSSNLSNEADESKV